MIRALTAADAGWVQPLWAAAYPAPPSVEDVAAMLAQQGTSAVFRGDSDVPAFVRMLYYEIPATGHAVPVGPGWRSQVEPMLPLLDGLFTNLTMPRILLAGLDAALAAFPAAATSQPVWAMLDEATAEKYRAAFASKHGFLSPARRIKRQGRYIWASRLQDARDVLARVLA